MATLLTNDGRAILTNRLKGSGTEPLYTGFGTGLPAAAATDVGLFAPSSVSRATGVSTQATSAVTNDTYQVVSTLTANAALAITEYGQFDSAAAGPTTTLTASATAGATSFTVTSGGVFTVLPISAQIETEVVSITATGATTLTVTRGTHGTSGVTHASGFAITGGNAASGQGGNMFIHSSFSVQNLASGDSIQFTSQLTFS